MSGRRFRRALRIGDPRRDLDEELAFHRDQVIREIMSTGLTRAEAEQAAAARFGDEERYRGELSAIAEELAVRRRWARRMEIGLDGAQAALRSFRRSPVLSFAIVVTLALGIGANATVFSVIDRLLLRAPPGITDPGTLRKVYTTFHSDYFPKQVFSESRSYPELDDFRAARSLSGIAGYNFATHDLTIGSADAARRAKGMTVTGNYFGVIGARPALGRLIDVRDDAEGAELVAVLSYGYWQREYGGATDVLGKTLEFGRGQYQVVGVLAKGFTGVNLNQVDIWMALAPWRAPGDPTWRTQRGSYFLNMVARLRPGVTDEHAAAELTTLNLAGWSTTASPTSTADAVARKHYPRDSKVVLASLIPGESPNAPKEVMVARWLLVISILLLLIACTNTTNLLLARAIRERRANAVRLALGVTRGRLVVQAFVEVLVFALIAGIAAVLMARICGLALQRTILPDYAWDGLGFDPLIGWATLTLTVVAGLAVGLVPGVQVARRSVITSIREGAAGLSARNSNLRHSLAIVQIALSVVLLFGSVLFVRSFRNALHADVGIDRQNTYWVAPEFIKRADNPQEFYHAAQQSIARVRGVTAVGASSTLPFFNQIGIPLRAQDWDSLPSTVLVHGISGHYLKAMGLDIVRGRAIIPMSGPAPREAVISRSMEQRLYPRGALGKCLYVGRRAAECTAIVGVTEDAILSGIGADTVMQFYVPASQLNTEIYPLWGLPIRIDPARRATEVLGAVRRELVALDPRLRYVEIESFEDMLESQMRPWRVGAALFTVFGGLALIIALIGLHAVLTFNVTQRMRELGVRIALGASPGRVQRIVISEATMLAMIGSAAGAFVALVFSPKLGSLLYQVAPRDAVGMLAVVGVLFCASLLSATVPARRAARADPLSVMRAD